MKAIVLAAGAGKRLGEITKALPKPMIVVKSKPILEQNLRWLQSYGIQDIFINLHHWPQRIVDHLKNGSEFGVNISYSYEDRLRGTAGAVRKIADEFWPDWAKEKEFFLVVYGDNLIEVNLDEIITFHKKKGGIATIGVYEKRDDLKESGIVLIDNDSKVLKFIEKPQPHQMISRLVNAGIYLLTPQVLRYIPPAKAADFGKDVFPQMLQAGESVFACVISGRIVPIDSPELLNRALE